MRKNMCLNGSLRVCGANAFGRPALQTFGASRGRVVLQLLTESLLLAALGGILGILLGKLGIEGLGRLIPPDQFQSLNLMMDRTVLAFTAAVVGLVTLAFGLVPAWQASRSDVQETLKEGGRTSSSSSSHGGFRSALPTGDIPARRING
jgi:predicted lysophospholipase L1 biosynthesis ABC-type transport system permease subunit